MTLVMEQLEETPHKWEETKKNVLHARERLGSLQTQQAEKIKEQAEDFGLKVAEFRAQFSAEAPFKYDVGEECYKRIDEWNVRIDEIDDSLSVQGDLLELAVSDESEPIPAGREERTPGPLGAWDWFQVRIIELSEIQ